MSYILQTENLFEALHQNTTMVAECYGNTIKCFTYHASASDWSQIVKWHKSRHPRPVYCLMDVREISHAVQFDKNNPRSHINWIPKMWVDLGIDPQHIVWIGNHHSMIDHQGVVNALGLDINTLWIRYFEAEAVFRHYHQTSPINRQGPHHQTLKTFTTYNKKYLALFGKPRKFMRVGAMIRMHQKQMSKDAVISSLAEGTGIDDCKVWASSYWPAQDIDLVLKLYAGSVDKITYDAANTDNSNYRGYPYDQKLYENTAISIVAETNDIGVEGVATTGEFWVTEKICRTMFNYHPFVVLSTPNFLKKLQSFGYQTFDAMVDESYDQELDHYQRLDKALDASAQLVDQIDTKQMRHILLNNFEILINVYNQTLEQVKSALTYASSIK